MSDEFFVPRAKTRVEVHVLAGAYFGDFGAENDSVEHRRIELLTSSMPSRRSTN
jgi:hypothetical protein